MGNDHTVYFVQTDQIGGAYAPGWQTRLATDDRDEATRYARYLETTKDTLVGNGLGHDVPAPPTIARVIRREELLKEEGIDALLAAQDQTRIQLAQLRQKWRAARGRQRPGAAANRD
jgi:hypothetical protein